MSHFVTPLLTVYRMCSMSGNYKNNNTRAVILPIGAVDKYIIIFFNNYHKNK
jgi:hypothetical protein